MTTVGPEPGPPAQRGRAHNLLEARRFPACEREVTAYRQSAHGIGGHHMPTEREER